MPAQDGPSLETYIETRFNLLTEALRDAARAQGGALGAAIEATKESQAAADRRYEQRFEAQEKAVQAAFAAQKEAINAALAAADRAVTKAELATEKRFESVNEFRGTLDNQQRTLIPRSEVDVIARGITDKIIDLTKTIDRMQAERQGIKGGYGYAVGIVGLVLTIVTLIAFGLKAFGKA